MKKEKSGKRMLNKKGITLIALVITVIILLILAGAAVSIGLNGEDVFSRANQAKTEWNAKVEEEDEIRTLIKNFEKQLGNELQADTGKEDLIIECSSSAHPIRFETQEGIGQSFSVDWGDGSVETYGDDASYVSHRYDTQDGTHYIVRFSGVLKNIRVSYSSAASSSSYRIHEIKQWGTTGLENVRFTGCENLLRISEPTQNSFANLKTISFEDCWALTSIPSNLFNKVPMIESFVRTFSGCTALTGEAIPLWKMVADGEANGYNGMPDGEGCYMGCTGLSNYDQIPDYWKNGNGLW